jgi:polysaccharide export outer membrane protein
VTKSADGKTSSVEIGMGSLTENVNPAEDIVLQPYDVITVERAEYVYVTGEVGRVGALEVGERESLSILQVLTISGGLSREARSDRARVLRPVLNSSRRAEIPVNIKEIMAGRENDFPLLPNDVLYVPRNNRRTNLTRAGLIVVPLIPTFILLAIR